MGNFRHTGFEAYLWRSINRTGVIGSDVPWLDCPDSNALTWVITDTE